MMNIVEMMKNPLFKKGFDMGFATKPVMLAEDEFNEDDHPRDENGRFSSEGGGSESGGGGDRGGTSIGNTTYEQFSKMSDTDKFDTLDSAAESAGRDFAQDFFNECPEIDNYRMDIAEAEGVDTVGSGMNPPEYDVSTSVGWEQFLADQWDIGVAETVLTEVMSEKDAKNCMDKMWDKYSK